MCLPAEHFHWRSVHGYRSFPRLRSPISENVFPPRGIYCRSQTASIFTLPPACNTCVSQVNIALILDGSGSIDTNEWALETDFAEDVVAAFADRNLFENGGTATYVQFASAVGPSGTFNSTEAFNDFIDAAGKLGGGTNIESGIARGRELLSDAPASSLSFMIVITDGNGGRPEDEADAARAEGTRVFAVGVGEKTKGILGALSHSLQIFPITSV